MSQLVSREFIHTVYLKNTREVGIKLILEPWFDEYIVPPGVGFKIVGHGPRDGNLEVVVHQDYIAVWPWREATIAIFHNDVELGGPRDAFFK